MNFRQIHLDFHTSPLITGIGEQFDKTEWQEILQEAAVNSITCFSSCHHGYSYHPTEVGRMHPNLKFNLLREQMDACHEIGIKVPIYLTGGVNNLASEEHPEWREINAEGRYMGWSPNPLTPGFHKMCFNTDYLDYLCRMLREAVTLFPDADGVFIDIVSQGECCCPKCIKDMLASGFDPRKSEDRKRFARNVLLEYYRRTTEAVRCHNPSMPVFHNSGNIVKGDREILPYFSHIELESLPTGGWGYDHYPLSAAYCRNLSQEFLGMTGKFHTTWGEFGGFKHPNALRYECAAMLAQGSKCSIGDQLHPCGKLDRSTYGIIGEAYREVAQKEAWCDHVKSGAKIAILGEEAVSGKGNCAGDIGAARLLLELHQPFDYLDTEMDFSKYSMLILPDTIRTNDNLTKKLQDYLRHGGKLVLSGISGFATDADYQQFDIGADDCGQNEFSPDYVCCDNEFSPDYVTTPFVMYAPSRKLKVHPQIQSLGDIYNPYFNRTYEHFSGHQHAPYRTEPSGFSAGTIQEQILYFAHPVFSLYRCYGNANLKQFVWKALERFANTQIQVKTTLPSQARVTIMEQPAQNRTIIHLLYANTILRGGICEMSGGNISGSAAIEVIEDLNPSPAAELSIWEKRHVKTARIVPEGKEIAFEQDTDRVYFKLEPFVCHQMIELTYHDHT